MIAETASWVGQVLSGGRYEVTAKLGEGGMGQVYRARDRHLDCDVVVKVPRRALLEDPEFAGRFAREIRSLVQLVHPHIVKVTDVGDHDGLPFAVLQYLAGGSLRDRQRQDAAGHRLPLAPEEIRSWLGGIAEALDFIHRQHFIHRDVKPENILFDSHGHAYLSDFGVAKVLADKAAAKPKTVVTETGMVLGTPQYMAPELLLGQPYDGRIDQYALAVMLYELLSGRYPFDGPTATAIFVQQTTQEPPRLETVVPSISPALAAAVHQALAKEPGQRFPDCTAFVRALVLAMRAAPAATVSASCPSCGKPLKLSPTVLGKKVRCPACKAPFQAPLPAPANSPSVEAARTETPKPQPALTPPASCPQPADELAFAPAGNPRRPTRSSSFTRGRWLAASVIVGVLLVGALAVYLLNPAQGTVAIETDVPDVQVVVKRDGEQVAILDPHTNPEVRLPAGRYETELQAAKPGVKLATGSFTLASGTKQFVRVHQDVPVARVEAPGVSTVVVPDEPTPTPSVPQSEEPKLVPTVPLPEEPTRPAPTPEPETPKPSVPDPPARPIDDPPTPPTPPSSRREVLFDGKDLSAWSQAGSDLPPKWKVVGSALVVAPGTGNIQTRREFAGNYRLHVEFCLPSLPRNVVGQARGNSGVFLHARYEIQILDTSLPGKRRPNNTDCGALFGQYPPLVHVCRPPGEWQTFDITFRSPRFDGPRLIERARVSLRHNGHVALSDVEIKGPTPGGAKGERPAGPIVLQEHGSAVKFRNIWIEPLEAK